MNTTLLIVYVIVALFMGLWVIWNLVKKYWKRMKMTGGIFIDQDKDLWALGDSVGRWRKITQEPKGMTDEDWEHYWRNYY